MNKSYGFGLIEVLVALLITALALFGLSAFLLDSMRESRSALLQAQAGFFLTDMLERIRTNPHASYEIDFGRQPDSNNDCENRLCLPAAMANYELAQWKCALGGPESSVCAGGADDYDVLSVCASAGLEKGCLALPEGDGQIRTISGGYEIKVRWRALAAKPDEYDELALSALL